MPEKFGGPKFWRRFIEAKPESTYGAYAGSTYPGSKPGGLDSFRILFNNLLQFLLGNESEDGAAVAGWDWRGALERVGRHRAEQLPEALELGGGERLQRLGHGGGFRRDERDQRGDPVALELG